MAAHVARVYFWRLPSGDGRQASDGLLGSQDEPSTDHSRDQMMVFVVFVAPYFSVVVFLLSKKTGASCRTFFTARPP